MAAATNVRSFARSQSPGRNRAGPGFRGRALRLAGLLHGTGDTAPAAEPVDARLVRRLWKPEGIFQYVRAPVLQLESFPTALQVYAVALARQKHGFRQNANAGSRPVGTFPEEFAGLDGDDAGVPEPDHGGGAGPDAVVARVAERAPHRQLQFQRRPAAARRHVVKVLATIHAQPPAHDPVPVQRAHRQLRGAIPGLDGVGLVREAASQL